MTVNDIAGMPQTSSCSSFAFRSVARGVARKILRWCLLPQCWAVEGVFNRRSLLPHEALLLPHEALRVPLV